MTCFSTFLKYPLAVLAQLTPAAYILMYCNAFSTTFTAVNVTPFSDQSINCICGLSLLWLFPLLREVFLQVLRFSLPTVPNASNSTWNSQRHLNLELLRTPIFFSWANILNFTKFYTDGRRQLSPQHLHPCLEPNTCRTYDSVVILMSAHWWISTLKHTVVIIRIRRFRNTLTLNLGPLLVYPPERFLPLKTTPLTGMPTGSPETK